MYVKVKRLWLLPDASCEPEAGKTLADYLTENRTEFVEFNMVDNPTMFSAAPAVGTYNCMIMEMSDIIQFRPDMVAQNAHGIEHCDESKNYYFDIFHGSNVWYNPVTDKDDAPSGTDQYATAADYETGYQAVYMFATTAPGQVTSIHANAQTMDLTAAIVIADETSKELTFVLNTKDKITEGYSTVDTCSMEQPAVSVQ